MRPAHRPPYRHRYRGLSPLRTGNDTHCRRFWPRSPTRSTDHGHREPAHARSNAPATTATASRNQATRVLAIQARPPSTSTASHPKQQLDQLTLRGIVEPPAVGQEVKDIPAALRPRVMRIIRSVLRQHSVRDTGSAERELEIRLADLPIRGIMVSFWISVEPDESAAVSESVRESVRQAHGLDLLQQRMRFYRDTLNPNSLLSIHLAENPTDALAALKILRDFKKEERSDLLLRLVQLNAIKVDDLDDSDRSRPRRFLEDFEEQRRSGTVPSPPIKGAIGAAGRYDAWEQLGLKSPSPKDSASGASGSADLGSSSVVVYLDTNDPEITNNVFCSG
jgi:hypothetical protein